ncbi:class I SAM-dependent methyltransferase, partial [Citrobacter sp. UMB8248A]|nr:class I SAM-dependent methyltransferase [Citrobacter sp. UMB8248A]
PDQSFDIVTIGFGLRNVPDANQVLKEIYRVLKPTGKVGVLETSQPTNPLIKLGWKSYFRLFPSFAKLLGANVSDYQYLSHTTAEFVSAQHLKEMLVKNGFKNVQVNKLNLGAGA